MIQRIQCWDGLEENSLIYRTCGTGNNDSRLGAYAAKLPYSERVWKGEGEVREPRQ